MENSNNKKWLWIIIALLLAGALYSYFTQNSGVADEDTDLEDETSSTRIVRDYEGNIVPRGTLGAKYADEYVCADFDIQSEAQTFFDKAGIDAQKLDIDGNGLACEELPEVLK